MKYLDPEKQIQEYKRQIASLNYYKKQHKQAIVNLTNKQLELNTRIQHIKKDVKRNHDNDSK